MQNIISIYDLGPPKTKEDQEIGSVDEKRSQDEVQEIEIHELQ